MEIHISRNTYLVEIKKWDLNGELFYQLNVIILSIFYISTFFTLHAFYALLRFQVSHKYSHPASAV